MLGAQFFGCRLGARLPEDADDLFLAESLSFHEVCGVDITTQTPVQACLLFGEQVTKAQRTIFDYLEVFYNDKRRHSSLGNVSPETFLNQHFQTQKTHLN